MDSTILNAALEYASKGWSVIPISKNKQPLIKWKTATREELTNPDNIKKWWKQYPAANVAIVTGERSGGLVVIDLDIDDQKGIDGQKSLEDWCDQNYMFCLDSSATVETGRGGKHLYFQSDYKYHNQVGCLEGVDIRGEGGCVVAPPSVHGTTNRTYTWDIDQDEIVVPTADSDVVYFLASMETKQATNGSVEKQKNDFTKITKEGGRNNQLFKYVSRLQGEGEPDDAIREYAKIYNETHLTPPLSDDEVQRTIDSVLSHAEWKGTAKKEPEEKQQPIKKSKVTIRKLKTAEDLMKKDLPEPKVFIGVDNDLPFLLEGTCILSAKPKLGKSWLALGICIAVANGSDFLGYKTNKCSTLYLDLETSETLQQKRLRKILHGAPVPKNFYLETETNSIDNGFVEQIEAYLEEDPDIGIVVIDVFQIVRTAAKGIKETEYEHAYRDITPLNELAQRRHISIILVCHDRKAVDPDDPFSNILGSTGLQGAATQMIVMFRKRKEDPIHISIKGKTIDGLPELDVNLDDANWSIVEGGSSVEREQAGLLRDYKESDIRAAVLKLTEKYSLWQGASRQLIETSVEINSPIMESSMATGGFLNKHLARFLTVDGIKITVIHNGTGAKKYRIEKATVDTVDDNDIVTVDGFMNPSEYNASENPFL